MSCVLFYSSNRAGSGVNAYSITSFYELKLIRALLQPFVLPFVRSLRLRQNGVCVNAEIKDYILGKRQLPVCAAINVNHK